MLPLIRLSASGRILNISSAAGSLTFNSDPAFPYRSFFGATYPATKTALNAITLALAIELESIKDIHRMAGPGPVHPLITLIDVAELFNMCVLPANYVLGFYKISLVTHLDGKFKYGQGYYDFDEGSMVFAAPQQE